MSTSSPASALNSGDSVTDNANPTYIVCGCRSWNRQIYLDTLQHYPGRWHYIDSPSQLTTHWLGQIRPRYIFFLHWSWIVPAEIHRAYECICFHMTDVPYGRGGSPLQNLILRGHTQTMLTALRMEEQVDAGPVYFKQPLSLQGSAQDILIRATKLTAVMIQQLITEQPAPTPQEGEVVAFKRRRPDESQLPGDVSIEQLHDFIRMLDGEGYPPAFIRHGDFLMEFTHARLDDGQVEARVKISKASTKDNAS